MLAELALVAALSAVAGAAQQEPPPRKGYVQWTYTDQQFTDGAVALFSVCLDAQPCVHVDPVATKTTVPGWYEWKLPALTIGSHVVTVQACNADDCSSATAAKFSVRIVPEAPAIVRVPSGGGTP